MKTQKKIVSVFYILSGFFVLTILPSVVQSAEVTPNAFNPSKDSLTGIEQTTDPFTAEEKVEKKTVSARAGIAQTFFSASALTPPSSSGLLTAASVSEALSSSVLKPVVLPFEPSPIVASATSRSNTQTSGPSYSFNRSKKPAEISRVNQVNEAFKAREEAARKREQLIYRQETFAPTSKDQPIKNREGKITGYRLKDGAKILYRSVSASWIEIRNAQGMVEHVITSDIQKPEISEEDQPSFNLGKNLKVFYQNPNAMEVRNQAGVRWILESSRQPKAPSVHEIIYLNGTREFLYRGFVLRRVDPQGKITDFTPDGSKVR